MKLDSIDRAIISAIRWNAKVSLQQVAKKIHVPLSTVHHRIKRFEDEGVIKRYDAVLDYAQLERPIEAFIMIQANSVTSDGKKVWQHEIIEHLKHIPAVEEAFIITGGSDLMVRVRVRDLDEMNELLTIKLRKIDGVGSTQTLMVLKGSGHKPSI
jgi:DNA-binding Lrp family transcriptional regulator